MTITVLNEQRIVQLQLAAQQGPAGASTVAAQQAATAAQESQLEAAASAGESAASALQSAQSATESENSATASAASAVESANSAIAADATRVQVDNTLAFIRDNFAPDFTFPDYNTAVEAYLNGAFPIGTVVAIINDERFNGARTYTLAAEIAPALSMDFANDTYSTSDPLEFLAFGGISFLDPPVLSDDFGFAGAVAVDETYFYAHTGTVWKRVMLEAF